MKKADTDTLLQENLLERILDKKHRLDKRRPLPKTAVAKLLSEIRLQHTYHSNAIEGNALTLSETRLVLEEGLTVGQKPLKDYMEAKTNVEAFILVEKLAKKSKKIDHIVIQEIHEILMKGLTEDAGKYRTRNVRIVGSPKTPPDYPKVPRMMEGLYVSMRNSKAEPVTTAAAFHHGFVAIHPFSDGNGRMARLLNNLLLMQWGYPPIVLRNDDRPKYYKYLRLADSNNLAPFTNFIGRAVDESLLHYLSIFGKGDQLIPLKELAFGSPYSQEYLSLRVRQGRMGGLKIGGIWHSTRNAMNRYVESLEMK
jgi:Fic family protein